MSLRLSEANLHVLSFSFNAHQYYILASSVAFYYDFALTMAQEIKHVWSSKLKLVNVLIIALRYITAFGYIPILVLTFTPVVNGRPGELVSFTVIRSELEADMNISILSAVVSYRFTVASILS